MPSLLETGIYTVPEAAALVGVPPSRLRVWIEGHKGKQEPVIDNQLDRVDDKTAISFTNLLELRFVALFVGAGVQVRTIRAIMNEVKQTLEHPHPFATRIVFRTDGKKVVADIAKKNGIDDIYDLKSRNYEMRVIVMASLKEDVVFDPKGEAISWSPRPKIAPHVMLHPFYSFGHPVLRSSRIPTKTLARAVKAERSAKTVSELFEVPELQVREAVKFEEHLRAA